MHPMVFSLYTCLFVSIYTFLYGAMTNQVTFDLTPLSWLYTFIVAVSVSVGANAFLQVGIRYTGASTSAILSMFCLLCTSHRRGFLQAMIFRIRSLASFLQKASGTPKGSRLPVVRSSRDWAYSLRIFSPSFCITISSQAISMSRPLNKKAAHTLSLIHILSRAALSARRYSGIQENR